MNRRSFFGSLAALVAGWWGVRAAKAETVVGPIVGVDIARDAQSKTLLIFRDSAGRYHKWPVPTSWLKAVNQRVEYYTIRPIGGA